VVDVPSGPEAVALIPVAAEACILDEFGVSLEGPGGVEGEGEGCEDVFFGGPERGREEDAVVRGYAEVVIDTEDVVVAEWLVGHVLDVPPPDIVVDCEVACLKVEGFGYGVVPLSGSSRASMIALMRSMRIVSHSVLLMEAMLVSFQGRSCGGSRRKGPAVPWRCDRRTQIV
jgi:hypothetical protein